MQGNGNISVSLEESQVHTTGPLIAEPQKVTSTPEIIIAPTETDVLEKNATNVSLQEADPINLVTTTTEKITEEIVPFPDRVSAPYMLFSLRPQ